MKGIVFTEFLEMVEERFGLETADRILEASELPSGGIYTSVGTYGFNEMVTLLTNLSVETEIPAQDLLYAFGLYLFDSLGRAHPEVIANYTSPMGLIGCIEDHIHVHVKKLYPDAELPSFQVLEEGEKQMDLVYRSSRGLYSLCHGLLEKTFIHFGQEAEINYELVKSDGTEVRFHIVQKS